MRLGCRLRRSSQNAETPEGPADDPRRAPAATPRRAVPQVKEHVTELVVDVGDRAHAWRAAALDAELAFLEWTSAPSASRGRAAARYLAAITHEEQAATEYGAAWEACCTTFPRPAGRPGGAGREPARIGFDPRRP